jgi:thiamine-phosphate pyrophosphorylase
VSRRGNPRRHLLPMPRKPPILCYVTDRRSLRSAAQENVMEALLQKVEEAAAAGIDWMQLREKDLSGKDCAALTRESLRLAAQASPNTGHAPRILVNDRVDVALVERAGGVHLGESSLPVEDAKRLIATARPPLRDFLVGVSCHSLEAAQSAARAGANYVFFGPVFATPSKATFGQPQGLLCLAQVCRAVDIPVLAIGGITLENAAQCLAAGAAGIAAIRLFQDAGWLPLAADALRQLEF